MNQKLNPHKVFPNLIKQDFSALDLIQCWGTDFAYLFLKDGSVRYNCTILDSHDRSIISSITDKEITSDLAIRTLKKALQSQPKIKGELIYQHEYKTDEELNTAIEEYAYT